jgi:hypothetical protein
VDVSLRALPTIEISRQLPSQGSKLGISLLLNLLCLSELARDIFSHRYFLVGNFTKTHFVKDKLSIFLCNKQLACSLCTRFRYESFNSVRPEEEGEALLASK